MRKFSMILVVCTVLVVSSYALASVHGEWNVDRSEKWSLKIGKAKPTIETHTVLDVWRFRDDNSFLSSTFSGSWKQKGARFDVYIDEAQVAAFIQNQFLANGVPVSATLKKLRIYGSEKNIYGVKNREWMIKGKYEIKADIVFPDLSVGKLDIKGDFMGTLPFRTADYFPLNLGDTWTMREVERNITDEGEEIDIEIDTNTVFGTEKVKSVIAMKRGDENAWYDLMTNTDGVKLYKSYELDDDDGMLNEIIETYNPPLVFLPAGLSVGTRGTFKSTVTHKESRGFKATGKVTVEMVVEGIEDVTVPAGTFRDCLRIKMWRYLIAKKVGHEESYEGRLWLARNIGLVKSESTSIDKQGGVVEEIEEETQELLSATVGGVNYP